jgi:HEAT repeat protein
MMSRAHSGSVVLVAAMAVSVGVVGGCASAPESEAGPSRSGGASAPATQTMGSVERSQLRERAIESLLHATQAPEPQMRANSIEGLLLAPTRLDSAVALGLKDENLGVRSVAAMAVGRARVASLGAASEPLLADGSPFVRISAIYAQVRLKRPVDPGQLAGLLLTDPSPRVRAHAAYVLGELGNRSASGMLRQALLDKMSLAPAEEVRLMQLQIAEALVKLGDSAQVQTVRAALYPSRPEELEAAALAIQIIGEVKDKGAIDQLIYLDAYRDETGQRMPAEVRLALASAMAKMGMREGAFIATEFQASPIPAVRAQAASVFGETGQRENLAQLAAMMDDPDGFVRVAAAAAVLKITAN